MTVSKTISVKFLGDRWSNKFKTALGRNLTAAAIALQGLIVDEISEQAPPMPAGWKTKKQWRRQLLSNRRSARMREHKKDLRTRKTERRQATRVRQAARVKAVKAQRKAKKVAKTEAKQLWSGGFAAKLSKRRRR